MDSALPVTFLFQRARLHLLPGFSFHAHSRPACYFPAIGSPYGSSFSHSNEVATPGYYSVRLDNGIQASLTVTARSGFGIFAYPRASAATMLINAGGSATGDVAKGTGVRIIPPVAQSLGDSTLYAAYIQRSHDWQNLFNVASGYIEPRNPDGSFIANFSPTSEDGFVESNGLQYSWMVPYDQPALFKAMGGNEKVVRRLDAHFTMLNAGPNSPYAFMGNEPEFEVPWEYDFAGAAYRTQDIVRRITTQLFQDIPGGLPGNDDGGAMSSWYVFAALGFYPEIPGVAGFALSSPLFPSITVHLGNGHDLHIIAQGSSQSMRYVQSLSVNGQPYTSAWLPFAALAQGATMRFTLGSQPNSAWGNHI